MKAVQCIKKKINPEYNIAPKLQQLKFANKYF